MVLTKALQIMGGLVLVAATATLSTSTARAHGEDKLGPNRGFVQMPGPFHTEVVPEGAFKFRIYLLDFEFKNPMLRNSSVQARWENGSSSKSAKCVSESNHFLCEFPSQARLERGRLIVKATRDKQLGTEAVYELPLKLKPSHDGH